MEGKKEKNLTYNFFSMVIFQCYSLSSLKLFIQIEVFSWEIRRKPKQKIIFMVMNDISKHKHTYTFG